MPRYKIANAWRIPHTGAASDTLLNALDVDRDLFDVAGCFLGYHGRTRLVRAAGTRDIHIAVLEDILAIGGSLWAVSRF